jgi:predicted aspartyl protease
MRAWLLLAAVLIDVGPPRQALVRADELALPFAQGSQGGVIVPVRVNDRGPFRFLLDTGSTHTALAEKTATRLGLPPVARTTLGSAAGRRETLVARLEHLAFGPITIAGLLSSLVDLDAIDGMDDVDGVLGQDALAALRYTIDFRRQRLLFWPTSESTERGTTLDLQPNRGRFLVALPQEHSTLTLVPDSGAGALLLFDTDAHQLPLTPLPHRATLTTMSGAKDVSLARLRELRVGESRLRDVPAVVVRRDASEPAEADGLLPLHLFDRVTFDGPRNRLIVEGMPADAALIFF